MTFDACQLLARLNGLSLCALALLDRIYRVKAKGDDLRLFHVDELRTSPAVRKALARSGCNFDAVMKEIADKGLVARAGDGWLKSSKLGDSVRHDLYPSASEYPIKMKIRAPKRYAPEFYAGYLDWLRTLCAQQMRIIVPMA